MVRGSSGPDRTSHGSLQALILNKSLGRDNLDKTHNLTVNFHNFMLWKG
jgi:hypothetical protein